MIYCIIFTVTLPTELDIALPRVQVNVILFEKIEIAEIEIKYLLCHSNNYVIPAEFMAEEQCNK